MRPEEGLVALFQAMVDEKHPTVLPLWRLPSLEALVHARTLLAAHGLAFDIAAGASTPIVSSNRDTKESEIPLVLQLKVTAEQPSSR
jgi:hypothetical protein